MSQTKLCYCYIFWSEFKWHHLINVINLNFVGSFLDLKTFLWDGFTKYNKIKDDLESKGEPDEWKFVVST